MASPGGLHLGGFTGGMSGRLHLGGFTGLASLGCGFIGWASLGMALTEGHHQGGLTWEASPGYVYF